ncbi:MAG TPA: exodeoxyribonuclease V subunit gamma, partial [Acidimicrobiales bacterium]
MAPRRGRGLSIRFDTSLVILADALSARLSSGDLGVLEPEVVVVPTRGMASWVESRLSRTLGATELGDGIFANVDTLLVGELVRRIAGRKRGEHDPWTIGPMTIALIAALSERRADQLVGRDGQDDADSALFSTARSMAELFDRLFRWRPDVADAWLDGSTEDPRAELLRQLAARSGLPAPHRALGAALERLLDGDDAGLDLPSRVQLFGGDSLPGGAQFVAALDALGTVRDVSLHLVVPSVGWFTRRVESTPIWGLRAPDRARRADDTTTHPLLRTWGTSSADAAAQLAQLPTRPTTSLDGGSAQAGRRPTLLGALQDAITQGPRDAVPADGSVSLHGCVGDLRQVEVVRDAILHALADDPELQASDVVVLCADLARFAPFVEAVLGEPQGAPALPYQLRDRAVSRVVPLVAAMESALGLLGGRFPRSAVVDLLRFEMVQRRFGLEGEDVDRIAEWTTATDVRWGLDAAHRTRVGLPERYEAGTWHRALDRLLAGVALPDGIESEPLGLRAATPGHDLERVGSLCDAITALADLDDACAAARPVDGWCDFARGVLGALFTPTYDEAGQVQQLQRLLSSLEDDAGGVTTPVTFHEFRTVFGDRASRVRDLVASGPGGVTVTSLAPLRGVPFGVVAILGLDDRSLERPVVADLAMGEPRVGDPDPRADVRAALLSAILSAQQRLVVTYEAADVVSNEPVAPAAVLAELREALAERCSGTVSSLEHRHPRHAHGDDDLMADGAHGSAFTFDAGAYERALELRVADDSPGPVHGPVPAPARGRIDRTELHAFLTAPQRTFLRSAFDVRLPGASPTQGDELSMSFDPIERMQVTRALVTDGLTLGVDVSDDTAWATFLTTWAARFDGPLSMLPGLLGARALGGPEGIETRSRDLLRHVARARGPG